MSGYTSGSTKRMDSATGIIGEVKTLVRWDPYLPTY